MFSALRNPLFRLLWLGSLSAFLGFFASTVVQAIVAFNLTGRNDAVGTVSFARGLSQVLVAPLGGALADRWSKRNILLTTQTFTAGVFLTLAWLAATGQLTVQHLATGGSIVGLTFALIGPARSAYVLELVAPPQRPNALALNQIALNASRVAGPALGGALVALPAVGAAGAFIFMGAAYAGAAFTQGLLPRPSARSAGDADKSLLGDVLAGLAYVRGHGQLRAVLLMFVLTVMFGFPHVTVLPGLVEHQLHGRTAQVSVLFTVSAVGALLASLVMARLSSSPRALDYYRLSGLGFGLSLMLLQATRDTSEAALVMFLVGASSGSMLTLNGAVLLRFTEARYMGRVMSLAMLAFGGFGLLALPFGWLADAIGEGATAAVMGVCVIAGVAWQSRLLAHAARAATAQPA